MTWGTGTTGALTADFHAVRVRVSPTHAERWLLCERSPDDVRTFYLLNLAATVPLKALVAMARAR